MSWNKDTIVSLLEETGEIALRVRSQLKHEFKADHSIVTQADREIERTLARALERPDEGTYFIGEETVAEKGDSYVERALQAETYVVDPIDGTVPYAYGMPNWGISVGRMQNGALTDGAVYLVDYGELIVTEGDAVLEGTRQGDRWSWRELTGTQPMGESNGPVAVTQAVAKRGRADLPNPVLVLGSAVVPLVGLMQGRFFAYLGSVRLWDVAGALPALQRKGFSISVFVGDERRTVTPRVEEATYHLSPSSSVRWALKSNLLVCHPEDELRLRCAFVRGDGFPEEGTTI